MSARGRERFCAGVDVGGTKISAALFSPTGEMSRRAKVAVDKSTPDAPAGQIAGLIRDLEAALGAEGRLEAVGICIPGVVFREDGAVWAPNIRGWDRYPLAARLRKSLALPLVLDSDRSAYVLGEAWRGAARGLGDVVFLAVGTGIGAGILAGGRLVRGANDIAGAVGWFALNPVRRAGYAERGSFETEASGDAVGFEARTLARRGEAALMTELAGGEIDRITSRTVIEAAGRGDPAARRILDAAAAYLAMGIANLVSLLNPEMVVLGGGLFQGAPQLVEILRREFKIWAQPLAAERVALELSALGEDAGLYGAGRLAWDAAGG